MKGSQRGIRCQPMLLGPPHSCQPLELAPLHPYLLLPSYTLLNSPKTPSHLNNYKVCNGSTVG